MVDSKVISKKPNGYPIIVCGNSPELGARLCDELASDVINCQLSELPGNGKVLEEFVLKAAASRYIILTCDIRLGLTRPLLNAIKMAAVIGVSRVVLAIDFPMSDSEQKLAYDVLVLEFETHINRLRMDGSLRLQGKAMAFDLAQVHGNHFDDLINVLKGQIIEDIAVVRPFRMAVNQVADNLEIYGEVLDGGVGLGDTVIILPSGERTQIAQVNIDEITSVKLAEKILVSPGDWICVADNAVQTADQFETTLIWFWDHPMLVGRPYLLQMAGNQVDASFTQIKYCVKPDRPDHIAANDLHHGEIGVCNLSLGERIAFESSANGHATSQFKILAKDTGQLVGFGVFNFSLRRASNVHWQNLDVTRELRAQLKGQKPAILWFTGLSGSGKSAIANILEKKLSALGKHTYILDGDNIRHGLNRDLGFTDIDRVENIRRISEVARLMADSGLIVLVSFISPFRSERQLARELAQEGEFIEIHVDTPLAVAEARDIKGLYKKARAGKIKNFTGIDSAYEPPEAPEIRVDTVTTSADEAAQIILDKLGNWGMIKVE